MRHYFLPLFLCTLLLTSETPARANSNETHMLGLGAGDRLRGECLGIDNGILSWRTVYGDTLHVPVGAISELTCEESWDLQFGVGQTMRAPWSIANGELIIQSSLFGTLHCPAAQLRSGVRAVSARGLESETPPASATAATPAETPSSTAAPAPAAGANEAPPSSLQTLLRQSSILLQPKEWRVSTGFQYTHNRLLYSPDDSRQLTLISQLQYGITPRIEGSLQWPVYLTANTNLAQSANPPGIVTTRSANLRAGNPELGGAAMLFGEGRTRPECVLVGGLTIPVNPASAGGVFKSRIGLEFLKTSDPGALFGGFGWIHEGDGWQRSPYEPLDRLTYHLGAAIGLNDELAIGFQAQGTYSPALHARNGILLSTQQEIVQGRFWFNLRTTQYSNVEAAIDVPLSTDAHATTFGITYIRRY